MIVGSLFSIGKRSNSCEPRALKIGSWVDQSLSDDEYLIVLCPEKALSILKKFKGSYEKMVEAIALLDDNLVILNPETYDQIPMAFRLTMGDSMFIKQASGSERE